MTTYDAIVVGARCAGSPTAMLLARLGYEVLLLDKSTFPSDMPLSTHWVHQPSIERLRTWGLLPHLEATDCPPIEVYDWHAGPLTITGAPRPAGQSKFSYAPRRKVLDQILVDGAVKAGAELREGVDVEGLLTEGDAVIGVRAKTRAGAIVEERAAIVVGADGMNSRVASWVAAPSYNEEPALNGQSFAYWSGVPLAGAELWLGERNVAFALPTNEGLSLIGAARTIDDFPKLRAGGEQAYLETVAAASPSLAGRLAEGRLESSFIRTTVSGYYRKPYGHGWALVGDAGYKKDPCTASGITDAFRDAELLSQAIDDGLSGRRDLQEALADYERVRNETTLAHYQFTTQLASFAPPTPEMEQLLFACSQDSEVAGQLFSVVAQTMTEEEFFAPANVKRLLAGVSG